ncbi:MAG: T9SS type A sorting domain-containing protein, partial [Bacteroidota bacterium]
GGAGKGKVTTTDFSMNRETPEYFADMLDGTYAVADGSFYTSDLGDVIGDRNWDSEVTNTNDLSANHISLASYPNPLRQNGTLEYALDRGAEVSIEWYDVAGRQLRQEIKGFQSAGFHRTSLRSEQLRPGLYFVKLRAGGRSGILRLTVQ